jgi:aspartate kinase
MSRLVMKFGGTSVADVARIRNAAERVKREVDAGHEVAVVVSAMSGKTNELVSWVRDTSRLYDAREYDAVVASGENVTAGLMALTLQEMGVPARSWQGWQVPVQTTSAHGAARIESIDTERLEQRFSQGVHAVIAGFQGISPEGRITTLGRGGSDTSAVAFAAALNADRCDIYTDVDGVYTTDPRITKKARKLGKISYEEMLELASLGAKVLQTRSVELAMRYKVRVQVLSSFDDRPGTLVCDEEEIVESRVVSGIAHTRDEAHITVAGVSDKPGIAAGIFGPLAQAGVNVDMIVQDVSDGGRTNMTFTVPIDDVPRATKALEAARDTGEIAFQTVHANEDVAKVSIVGIGMRSHAGVAHQMFQALAAEGINIKVITTSEIKVSVLVDRKYLELAVQALHDAFELEKAS